MFIKVEELQIKSNEISRTLPSSFINSDDPVYATQSQPQTSMESAPSAPLLDATDNLNNNELELMLEVKTNQLLFEMEEEEDEDDD